MRQFGIITAPSGTVTDIVVTSFTAASSAEIAEARNEEGKVTDLQAYSVSKNISVRGTLDTETPTETPVEAGQVFTLNGVEYLIESVNRTEGNTAYVEVDFSARRADNAAISADA